MPNFERDPPIPSIIDFNPDEIDVERLDDDEDGILGNPSPMSHEFIMSHLHVVNRRFSCGDVNIDVVWPIIQFDDIFQFAATYHQERLRHSSLNHRILELVEHTDEAAGRKKVAYFVGSQYSEVDFVDDEYRQDIYRHIGMMMKRCYLKQDRFPNRERFIEFHSAMDICYDWIAVAAGRSPSQRRIQFCTNALLEVSE
jgi:hypothetical protein